MQGCSERATVWRRDKNNFDREILSVLCSWRRKTERRLDGAGFMTRDAVGVIIPYVPGFKIAPGDLIALGWHEYEITGEKPFRECDIKAELGSDIITVQRVSYNLSGKGEHVRVEGI